MRLVQWPYVAIDFLRQHPAIHLQYLASDVRRIIRRQKRRGFGHVLRAAASL